MLGSVWFFSSHEINIKKNTIWEQMGRDERKLSLYHDKPAHTYSFRCRCLKFFSQHFPLIYLLLFHLYSCIYSGWSFPLDLCVCWAVRTHNRRENEVWIMSPFLSTNLTIHFDILYWKIRTLVITDFFWTSHQPVVRVVVCAQTCTVMYGYTPLTRCKVQFVCADTLTCVCVLIIWTPPQRN